MALLMTIGCIERVVQKNELPVYGSKEILVKGKDGLDEIDTITLKIDSFQVMDQDSQIITAADFKGKIYVVDFFFTHCPTICPVMTKNMSKVYDEFETGVLAGVPFTALLGQHSSFLLLSVLLLHALLLMVCFLTIHVTHLSCVSEKRLQSAVGDSVTSSIVPLRVQCHTKQTTCAIEIGGRAC